MSSPLQNLLAVDVLAQKTGCGLRPELRKAIEADLRFSPERAGPPQRKLGSGEDLPDSVLRLPLRPVESKTDFDQDLSHQAANCSEGCPAVEGPKS